MKNWIIKSIACIAAITSFCCQDSDSPVRKTTAIVPVLSVSANSIVLESKNAKTDSIMFIWSATDYGYVANVKYTLEIDKKGNNFADPRQILIDSTDLKSTNLNNIPGWKTAVLFYTLDSALNQLNINSASADVELRIKSITALIPVPAYSNVVVLTVKPYADVVIDEPVLNVSATTFDQATTDDMVFSWTATTYSLDDPITYTLQFDTNDDFASPIEVVIDDGTLRKKYSVKDFNSLAMNAGLAVKTPGTIKARIKSTQAGSFTGVAYSNVVSINSTPYNLYPTAIYLMGGSTSAGWDNTSNGIPFVKLDEGKFEIYAYLTVNGSGFKFLPTQTDYSGDWGNSKTQSGTLEQDNEDNATVPADGFYKINLDFTNKTFSVVKITWAVVGDATPGGWPTDPTTDPGVLTLVGGSGSYKLAIDVTLKAGEFKFRANNGWDINYGKGSTAGTLASGGPNFVSPGAGLYHIELILDPVNGYQYTITP